MTNDMSEARKTFIRLHEEFIKMSLDATAKAIENKGFSVELKEELIKLTQKILSLDFFKMPTEEAKKEAAAVDQLILKIIQDSLPEMVNEERFNEFDQVMVYCFRTNIARQMNRIIIEKAEEGQEEAK